MSLVQYLQVRSKKMNDILDTMRKPIMPIL